MSTSTTPPPNLAALQANVAAAWDNFKQIKAAEKGDDSNPAVIAARQAGLVANQALKAAQAAAAPNPGAPATGNPPNAPNPAAAPPYKKPESESDTLKRNLESMKTTRINIGVDDDTYSKVKVQKLVVLGNAAKATSQPDRIHDFIANILNRSKASTQITNGKIYYLTKEDYAIINKAFPDISNYTGLIRAPEGQNILSLTYQSILDAYNNRTIDAELQSSITLSGSSATSTPTSTTIPLNPDPNALAAAAAAAAAPSFLDDKTIKEIEGILKDLKKIKKDDFVAIVIGDFNNDVSALNTQYQKLQSDYYSAYSTYIDKIIAYHANDESNLVSEPQLIQDINTNQKIIDTANTNLSDFVKLNDFRRTHITFDTDLLQKLKQKYDEFITKIISYPGDTSNQKYKDIEDAIRKLDQLLKNFEIKNDGLIKQKKNIIEKEKYIQSIETNKSDIYKFLQLETLKTEFNKINQLLIKIKLSRAPDEAGALGASGAPVTLEQSLEKYFINFKTNYDTTDINLFFIYLVLTIFLFYFEKDDTTNTITENPIYIIIKKIYNKKNKYVALLENIAINFKQNFNKIKTDFIKKNEDIYKLLFKILKIFLKYMKDSKGALDNTKIQEIINNAPNPTHILLINNIDTFINLFMNNNEITFDKKFIDDIAKDQKNKIDLKAHIKQDLLSLIDKFIEFIKSFIKLYDYFYTFIDIPINVTNLNNYNTKWDSDDKQINTDKIAKDKLGVSTTETEIAEIFNTKLVDAKENENKVMEEYIDIIIKNVKSVSDNPNIIGASSSAAGSTPLGRVGPAGTGRGRGGPGGLGGTGSPGRGRGTGRGAKAPP